MVFEDRFLLWSEKKEVKGDTHVTYKKQNEKIFIKKEKCQEENKNLLLLFWVTTGESPAKTG